MRSSSFVMNKEPDFVEIAEAVADGFSHFGRNSPAVLRRAYGESSSKFPYVEGIQKDEWAWIMIFSQVQGCNNQIICDIQSRGDNMFAAIICFSLCKAFGGSVHDDGGYIEVGREFSVPDLEKAIKDRIQMELR